MGKCLCCCRSCRCEREVEDKNSAFCIGCTRGECGDYYLPDDEYYALPSTRKKEKGEVVLVDEVDAQERSGVCPE